MADDVLERITFKEDEKIFIEGDQGYQAYIVQDGEVSIVKGPDDEETVLATIGKGGMFGEMALIDESPRMATARGATGGVAIIVTKEMFNLKLQKTDTFVRGLLKILAEQSRRLSRENVLLKAKLLELQPAPTTEEE